MIICIAAVILIIFAFPKDTGTDGYAWVTIIGGFIAIIFGFVLLMCCKVYANKMSWRKRLLLYSVCEDIENTNLNGSAVGIKPGKEAAWIELGNKASLGKYHLTEDRFKPYYIPTADNKPPTVTNTTIVEQNKPQPSTTTTSVTNTTTTQVQREPVQTVTVTTQQQPVQTSTFVPARQTELQLQTSEINKNHTVTQSVVNLK